MELSKTYASDADSIFKSVIDICRKLGYHTERIDKSIRRIRASTSPSLLSYGEELEVIVSHRGENKSTVHISAKPKVWFNITADLRGPVERIFGNLNVIHEEIR